MLSVSVGLALDCHTRRRLRSRVVRPFYRVVYSRGQVFELFAVPSRLQRIVGKAIILGLRVPQGFEEKRVFGG